MFLHFPHLAKNTIDDLTRGMKAPEGKSALSDEDCKTLTTQVLPALLKAAKTEFLKRQQEYNAIKASDPLAGISVYHPSPLKTAAMQLQPFGNLFTQDANGNFQYKDNDPKVLDGHFGSAILLLNLCLLYPNDQNLKNQAQEAVRHCFADLEILRKHAHNSVSGAALKATLCNIPVLIWWIAALALQASSFHIVTPIVVMVLVYVGFCAVTHWVNQANNLPTLAETDITKAANEAKISLPNPGKCPAGTFPASKQEYALPNTETRRKERAASNTSIDGDDDVRLINLVT